MYQHRIGSVASIYSQIIKKDIMRPYWPCKIVTRAYCSGNAVLRYFSTHLNAYCITNHCLAQSDLFCSSRNRKATALNTTGQQSSIELSVLFWTPSVQISQVSSVVRYLLATWSFSITNMHPNLKIALRFDLNQQLVAPFVDRVSQQKK